MKRIPPYLRNKYILTTAVFLVYTLFLDDNDIFTIFRNHSKLNKITNTKVETNEKLLATQHTLSKLNKLSEVEKFAREKKFFKKDDEDIFVIFYED